MDKRLAIDTLVMGLSFSSVSGMWMLMTIGFAAPLWVPVGAIGVGLVALQELLKEDWFI
jgi:hypothetical protein